MNGGAMLVQVYIAKLGTASVAANAVSNSIFSVLYAAPSAVATLAVTIVGQCIGAGEKSWRAVTADPWFGCVLFWCYCHWRSECRVFRFC